VRYYYSKISKGRHKGKYMRTEVDDNHDGSKKDPFRIIDAYRIDTLPTNEEIIYIKPQPPEVK